MHRYSTFVAVSTFILIVAGGLVTSTGSGLSVPDWPLSYGRFFPPMVGGIRFEHTHRVIAGAVGLLTFALTALLWMTEQRKWLRGLGLIASIALLIQAILGGLTVIYLLPTTVSVLHACLAQTFFCLMAALALFTSQEWKKAPVVTSAEASSLRRLGVVTTLFIYLQLIVGSFVRHSSGKSLWIHFVLAFLIILHALIIAGRVLGSTELSARLSRHALLLGGLVVFQIFLGLGAFIFARRLPEETAGMARVLITTSHQALGALILATALLLTLRAFRLFR